MEVATRARAGHLLAGHIIRVWCGAATRAAAGGIIGALGFETDPRPDHLGSNKPTSRGRPTLPPHRSLDAAIRAQPVDSPAVTR